MSHQPDNIFAGTQVVALVEVRGPSDSLVQPRGAVRGVMRTPAVKGEHFLVRFPDGFEKSLERSQLEVLKHFKHQLPNGNPESGFEFEQFIMYRCVVGSRAYGLDNDKSDTDRRGIYLAPADLVSSGEFEMLEAAWNVVEDTCEAEPNQTRLQPFPELKTNLAQGFDICHNEVDEVMAFLLTWSTGIARLQAAILLPRVVTATTSPVPWPQPDRSRK